MSSNINLSIKQFALIVVILCVFVFCYNKLFICSYYCPVDKYETVKKKMVVYANKLDEAYEIINAQKDMLSTFQSTRRSNSNNPMMREYETPRVAPQNSYEERPVENKINVNDEYSTDITDIRGDYGDFMTGSQTDTFWTQSGLLPANGGRGRTTTL